VSKSRARKTRGNTLVEVVISIFIVAGAALVFSALIPPAVKTEKMVGNYQQATSLVQHKIDQLRAVGWGRLNYSELKDAGIVDASPTASPFEFDQVDELDTIYANPVGTIAVTDYSATVRKVTVTLTWSGSHAQQGNGSLTVEAFIARG